MAERSQFASGYGRRATNSVLSSSSFATNDSIGTSTFSGRGGGYSTTGTTTPSPHSEYSAPARHPHGAIPPSLVPAGQNHMPLPPGGKLAERSNTQRIKSLFNRNKEKDQEAARQWEERRAWEEQRQIDEYYERQRREELEERRLKEAEREREKLQEQIEKQQEELRLIREHQQEMARAQAEAQRREEQERLAKIKEQEAQAEADRLAAEERAKRARNVSSEKLRDLRELIRTKYELDNNIWSLRSVRKGDRLVVMEKMTKADAVLKEIQEVVSAWDPDEGWAEHEKDKVREIKKRVEKDGKRVWAENPPW